MGMFIRDNVFKDYYDLILDRKIWFNVSNRLYCIGSTGKSLPLHIKTPEQAAEYVLSLLPQYNTNLTRLLYV